MLEETKGEKSTYDHQTIYFIVKNDYLAITLGNLV